MNGQERQSVYAKAETLPSMIAATEEYNSGPKVIQRGNKIDRIRMRNQLHMRPILYFLINLFYFN